MTQRTTFLLFCFCLLFSVHELPAQYFIWGQDPGSLKWRQILTPNFRILFPDDYEEQAAYIADLLEYSYDHVGNSLGHRPRRVPVILHNHTVVANGFVGWAPARLEMFCNPPQNLDGHDWIESLAVHEFRHVVQLDKLNQGLTRVLTCLLGEQATGIVTGLYLPMWFLEGDAVSAETGLTHGGRGRIPSFEQGLRAQVLEKGKYTFEKATLGSIKDYVPDHYELGYQIVANARATYGMEVWDHVVGHVARKPHTLTAFNKGLSNSTGLSKTALYRSTMEHLDSVWVLQKSRADYTESVFVDPGNDIYTNYRYPVFIDSDRLLALKNALDDIPRVIGIDMNGGEEVLFTPGILNPHAISTNGRLVVWSEQRTDPRWEHRSWSEIHRFDLVTGKKEKLTRRTRYFAPAISPDGSKIAVAEVTAGNAYSLVVIDAATGQPLRRIATPGNDFLMTPSWHSDGHTLLAVALGEEGKRIVVSSGDDDGFVAVFYAGRTEISRPRFVSSETILFNGAFSGVDNIYALHLPTGEVVQVVSSPFGAVDADVSPDGTTLVWSDYSSMGYRIAGGKAEWGGRRPLDDVEDHSHRLYEVLAAQEGGVVTRSRIPRKEYLSIPYNKIAGLFNVHSWAPFSVDADNLEGRPGLSVMSQSPLSTSVVMLGYDYDMLEQQGRIFADVSYTGLYPVLKMRFESGTRESFYRDRDGRQVTFPWRENVLRLGASVPLRFQRGAYLMGLQPSLNSSITKVLRTADSPSFFRRNEYTSLDYRLFAYFQHRMVPRDLRPRLGLVLDINYRHTPFRNGGDMGSVMAGRALAYLPGLSRHHSIRLNASWQQRKPGNEAKQTINYSYGNAVNYPRGITSRSDDKATVLTADYAMPLFYPDWRIGPVFYIKRFSMNVFYDHAAVSYTLREENRETETRNETLHSYGMDLMSQLHLLRFFAPFNMGVRVMFPSTHDAPKFQFLWTINF